MYSSLGILGLTLRIVLGESSDNLRQVCTTPHVLFLWCPLSSESFLSPPSKTNRPTKPECVATMIEAYPAAVIWPDNIKAFAESIIGEILALSETVAEIYIRRRGFASTMVKLDDGIYSLTLPQTMRSVVADSKDKCVTTSG
ncbi:predicted protein [Sclerotinia sclerotiorum 1980 UF-70]|uniref:Uncharacterized protein n=1 Tax=Sclerotinia sclerotiorum (strain ATCC 18683 / 1980 / Ss-1) TaxID=665079 RepID=A7EU53_SCLS1|nr:predicted protein [Sclerotinia sclerotiorum 1980 UF-70]EDN92995.1 predicted protein [Sclerotinia sclerotiorum 1980 UF-70]